MSDFKSKLPDFKELVSMGGKLINGIKSAVGEIVDDYKKKREPVAEKEPAAKAAPKDAAEPAVKKTPAAKKTEEKATTKD